MTAVQKPSMAFIKPHEYQGDGGMRANFNKFLVE